MSKDKLRTLTASERANVSGGTLNVNLGGKVPTITGSTGLGVTVNSLSNLPTLLGLGKTVTSVVGLL